jgi:hypothetical protein
VKRRTILPALVLILLGLWFLAGNLGIRLPGMGALWPIFPLGGGLLFLGGYLFDRRDPGLMFVGVGATLIGAFFFLFTLRVPLPVAGMQEGVRWSDMDKLWPCSWLNPITSGGCSASVHWQSSLAVWPLPSR